MKTRAARKKRAAKEARERTRREEREAAVLRGLPPELIAAVLGVGVIIGSIALLLEETGRALAEHLRGER
jgi:hypothetical protein